ncbi:hypothetical protein ACFE04_015504 [Oxalis oulophora]
MGRESHSRSNEDQGQQQHQQYAAAAAAQGSLFNLSLSEVQSQLGNINKPINLDGLLLKNINIVTPSPCSSSTSPVPPYFLGNFDLNGPQNQVMPSQLPENCDNKCPMMSIDPMAMVTNHHETEWLQLQMAAQQRQMVVLDSSFGYESNNGLYSDNGQLSITMPIPTMCASSGLNQAAVAAAERKRRNSDEMKEKSIERKRKRMMKNRESAARSRARKQAHTQQLENAVHFMRETNLRLRKQMEVEKRLLSSEETSKPRNQLRRTSSASF